jgi:hypothetical protein
MILFKKVNGKLKVNERHYWIFFLLATAITMMITVGIATADARHIY